MTDHEPEEVTPGSEWELLEDGVRMHIRVLTTWENHDSQGRTGVYFEYLEDRVSGWGAVSKHAKGYRPMDEFLEVASEW